IGILCWSAYQSLTPVGLDNTIATVPPPAITGPPPLAAGPAPEPIPETAGPSTTAQPLSPAPEPTPALAIAKEGGTSLPGGPEPPPGPGHSSSKAGPPAHKPAAARALSDGAVGVVEKLDGILLRFNGDKREWERIAEGAPLAASDRLLSLEPFR